MSITRKLYKNIINESEKSVMLVHLDDIKNIVEGVKLSPSGKENNIDVKKKTLEYKGDTFIKYYIYYTHWTWAEKKFLQDMKDICKGQSYVTQPRKREPELSINTRYSQVVMPSNDSRIPMLEKIIEDFKNNAKSFRIRRDVFSGLSTSGGWVEVDLYYETPEQREQIFNEMKEKVLSKYPDVSISQDDTLVIENIK